MVRAQAMVGEVEPRVPDGLGRIRMGRRVRTVCFLGTIGIALVVTTIADFSRFVTWARHVGSDCLIVVRHGNLLVQLIVDRAYRSPSWEEALYPDSEPIDGLSADAPERLDWCWPHLHKTFSSAVGTWWEVCLPLWAILAAIGVVALVQVTRLRACSSDGRHRPRPEGSPTGDSTAVALESWGCRPWTSAGRRVFAASAAASCLVVGLWVANVFCSVACYDGETLIEIERCAFVVRTVPEAEHYIRWAETTGWDFFLYEPPTLDWELPHTAELAQSTIGFWSELVLPFWGFFVLSAAPGAVLLWRHRKRQVPGFCRRCGYNLTGNVSGRCSECGTQVPKAGASA